jgi:hypothetical protein
VTRATHDVILISSHLISHDDVILISTSQAVAKKRELEEATIAKAEEASALRARSHCRFAVLLIHFITCSLI